MTNQEYVNVHCSNVNLKDTMLETMNTYGENKWWVSDDPIEAAYHQINEKVLLIDYNEMISGIDLLLERETHNQEWTWAFDYLKLQVEEAWKKYSQSKELSKNGYL